MFGPCMVYIMLLLPTERDEQGDLQAFKPNRKSYMLVFGTP
jgi:hypothetical protein